MRAKGLKRVDRLLREKTEGTCEVPGAVLLVRGPEGVAFCEAYGVRQRVPAELPMTRETLFDLASLTKPVCTSLLTMVLAQRGSLDLDQDLATWFSPVKDPAKRRITVRQLLSNRSGLPAWRPFYQEYRLEHGQPVSVDVLSQRILEEPLEGVPGKEEIYSDLGFLLLGSVLEKVSGRRLDSLFQEEIARPLGLKQIGYRRVQGAPAAALGEGEAVAATEDCPWRGRILAGEVHDENCSLLGGVAGHAGLFSTAGDLDRIAAEIFRGLQDRSGLFRAASLRTFFRRQDTPPGGTWALGWDTPSEKGSASGRHYSKNSVGHNGFTGTSMWMDCHRRVSVVFLTNRVHPSREATAIRALRPQVHDAVFEELFDE